MSMWLIAGGISTEGERPRFVELGKLIAANLPGDKKEKEIRKIQFDGLFFGLINHYLVRGVELDAEKLKKQFKEISEAYI